MDIAIDAAGDLYVAEWGNNRVQKFASDGTFLSAFGKQGSEPGQFDRAIAVAVANDGTVFAVDHGNNRIQKWRPK